MLESGFATTWRRRVILAPEGDARVRPRVRPALHFRLPCAPRVPTYRLATIDTRQPALSPPPRPSYLLAPLSLCCSLLCARNNL